MKYKNYISLFLCIIILTLPGCSLSNKNNNANPNPSNPNTTPNNPTNTPPFDSIKDQISKMTLSEKVGQLVMSGIDAYTSDDHTKELIDKYKVGGFILLGQNLKDTSQTLTLINSIKSSNSENKIPLFWGIDQEGGRISRLTEFTKLPTNEVLGQKNDSKLSFNIGSILGQELKAFGLNLDFAPVLDINSNPNNPVIGDRSFGKNADLVSELGIETMKGIQAQNIISGIKHFPGHGDTSVDSHVGLPIVYNDLTRLKSFELIPFSEAIQNGVDVVMVAHILLPNIDKENPASFSKTIITDVLRNYLKYGGVVITDDMTMGAIVKNYDIGQAAVQSLNAGTDIILVCHDFANETEVLKAISQAIQNKTISEESLNAKLYRILTLKQKYHVTDNQVKSVNVKVINDKIEQLLKS